MSCVFLFHATSSFTFTHTTQMLKNTNPILLLFLKALLLYAVWYVGYELFLAKNGTLDLFLNGNVTTTSTKLLSFLGYHSSMNEGHIVCIDSKNMVSVGTPCNGLVLYALFSGFLLVMPGKVINKIWFAIVGISMLYVVNVLRIVILSLNMLYSPSTFDFNHRYIYQIIVYVVIFMLWHIWVKQFSGLEITKEKPINS